MPWRQIFRIFTQNEQLMQKLSESGPIRYAARMTVYWFLKAKDQGMDKLKQDQNSADNPTKVKSFTNKFKDELHKGFKDLENERDKRKF